MEINVLESGFLVNSFTLATEGCKGIDLCIFFILHIFLQHTSIYCRQVTGSFCAYGSRE